MPTICTIMKGNGIRVPRRIFGSWAEDVMAGWRNF
jgi:hypothetical protein